MRGAVKQLSADRRKRIMADKIIIYGTDTCPFCHQARAAYGDRAVYVNVDEEPEKLKEMLVLTGGRQQVPVIVEGEKVTVGFVGEISLRGGIPLFGGT
jgi:glutaredoxin 3